LTGRTARLLAAVGTGVVLSGALVSAAQAIPAGEGTAVEKKLAAVVLNATPEDGAHKIVAVFAHKIGDALAYCVDWNDAVANRDRYHEAVGDEAKSVALPADKAGTVTAILAHGFGANTSAEVLAAAGITGLDGLSSADLDKVAFAGTQAALWHTLVPEKFTLFAPDTVDNDRVQELGKKFTDYQPVADGEWNAANWLKKNNLINGVYKYLLGKLGTPSLTISPATGNGTVGGKVGPFTVNAHEVTSVGLTVSSGGALVDKDGKAVTTLKDGGQFWVDCKAEGTVTITATGKSKVITIKLWTGKYLDRTGFHKLQTLATVDVTNKDVTANATATCAAAPTTPSLPVTGAPVIGTIAAGVVLLAIGAGLFLVRRRRTRFTA